MNRILLLSGLILLGTIVSAQSRWAFGMDIEGGVSGNKEVTDDSYLDSAFGTYNYRTAILRRPGMSAGIWTEYLLSQRFGLRLGVNYARMGTFLENENVNYNTSGGVAYYSRERSDLQQSQLRIPLEGKLYFGAADNSWRPFISLGAQATYLLAQVNTRESLGGGLGQGEVYEAFYGEKFDFTNTYYDISRWQVAVVSGLGVTTDRFSLSLQRSWGISRDKDCESDFYYCGFGTINAYLPYHSGNGVPQLRFTSLRFAYRLF
jgi:hypothetical protein